MQYDQASLQWTLETADQQKQNVNLTGNALQSITTKLNEPVHIELMTDGSMLPGGEQHSQHFIAANASEILKPPLHRVCMYAVHFTKPYTLIYRVCQNKTPQHENRSFSEICEYFCTKFCSTYNYPQIWCFMPHLVDVCQNDGNFNLKNKFCNWTNVDSQYPAWLLMPVWLQKPSDLNDFSQRYPLGITHQ